MGLFRIKLGCLGTVQFGSEKYQNHISAYHEEDLSHFVEGLFSVKVLNMDKLFVYMQIIIKEPINFFW